MRYRQVSKNYERFFVRGNLAVTDSFSPLENARPIALKAHQLDTASIYPARKYPFGSSLVWRIAASRRRDRESKPSSLSLPLFSPLSNVRRDVCYMVKSCCCHTHRFHHFSLLFEISITEERYVYICVLLRFEERRGEERKRRHSVDVLFSLPSPRKSFPGRP